MNLPPIKINIISVWKAWRAIRKFLHDQKVNSVKTKDMCIKKIIEWFKPDPIPVPVTTKKALFFAINDYAGMNNDLNGCINDQKDFIERLNKDFPGFIIKNFIDSQVTRNIFITEVKDAIKSLTSESMLLIHYSGHGTQTYDKHGDEEDGYDEAVYLYDGSVIDDDIADALLNIPQGATVVLMFDSCFSGSVTRSRRGNTHPPKNRYYQNPNLKPRKKKRIRIAKEDMKWIVFSGCGEQQTSADAYINGKYNGAFTYYALKTLIPGITYNEWITKINQFLPNSKFDQIPTLEGDETLFNKIVLI